MTSRRLAIIYVLLLLPLLLVIPAFVNIPDQMSAQRSMSYIPALQGTRPPPPTPISFTLTININPGSAGTVANNPNYPTYSSGTIVQLTASPAAGWQFSSWSGDLTGSANPGTIVMDGNKTVTANFVVATPIPTNTSTTSVTNTPTRTPTSLPGATSTVRPPTNTPIPALATVTLAPAATSIPATAPAPATITPLSSVATITPIATVTPIPSSALPATGMTFGWVIIALVLVLVVVGARYLRQSSS